jgi:hypothetical protein
MAKSMIHLMRQNVEDIRRWKDDIRVALRVLTGKPWNNKDLFRLTKILDNRLSGAPQGLDVQSLAIEVLVDAITQSNHFNMWGAE